MTVAFLFACPGFGAFGLFLWGCASCFSNPLDSRKARGGFVPAGTEVSDGEGLTPPLHPRKGHRPLTLFLSAPLFID